MRTCLVCVSECVMGTSGSVPGDPSGQSTRSLNRASE